MDFVQAVRLLRRRWYVAVPALLLAVVMSAGVFMTIGTRYQSTAVMVLTSPMAGGTFSPGTRPEDVKRINPLLAFDGSLTTTAQIVIQILRDPRTAQEIGVDPSSKDTYDVNNGSFGGSGPFVAVVSTTDSAAGATDLTDRVMNRAIHELRDRQLSLGAPESTLIEAQVLVRPTEADSLIGGKVRFAGAALMLGIIAALAAPFAVESRAQAKNGGSQIAPRAMFRREEDLTPVPHQSHQPPVVPSEDPPEVLPSLVRSQSLEPAPENPGPRRRRPTLRPELNGVANGSKPAVSRGMSNDRDHS